VDITEQRRAVDLLKASEERFRLLVEQAPDAIVLYDVDAGRFVDANQSAATLFGCSRDDLLKTGPLQFFLPEPNDGHSSMAALRNTIARHRPVSCPLLSGASATPRVARAPAK